MILLTRLKRQKRRKRQQDIPEFCKFPINLYEILEELENIHEL